MSHRLFLILLIVIAVALIFSAPTFVAAQEPTGGGTLTRDLTGGAALIFRSPANPTVHAAQPTGGGDVGGGKVTGRKTSKTTVREQDQILARANAARSAAQPRYSEAEQQYQLAARLAPDDARAFAGLGNVYVDQGRFVEAVNSYKQALKLQPDYGAAYMPLAFALARSDKYPESIEVYQPALKIDPTNPEVYNNLGFAFNHANRYAEAVDVCKQAIRLLGETGEAYKQGFQERNEVLSHAYKNLGNAYNGLNRYEEASEALKQATKVEPTNAAAYFNLGLTFYNADAFPDRYRGGAFIGQHGSWNRSVPNGYKVIFVAFENGRPLGPPEEILTGFLDEQDNALGRPVGVAVDRAGALLVADDVGNTVWRVTASNLR